MAPTELPEQGKGGMEAGKGAGRRGERDQEEEEDGRAAAARAGKRNT